MGWTKQIRTGRKVIFHVLEDGLSRSFRFLALKDRDFIEAAPLGSTEKQARAFARNNGLRIERVEREQG